MANREEISEEQQLMERFPLADEGNFIKRAPKPQNMGLTLHSKKVDMTIDENATNITLKREKQGLRPLVQPRSFLTWHVCLLFD